MTIIGLNMKIHSRYKLMLEFYSLICYQIFRVTFMLVIHNEFFMSAHFIIQDGFIHPLFSILVCFVLTCIFIVCFFNTILTRWTSEFEGFISQMHIPKKHTHQKHLFVSVTNTWNKKRENINTTLIRLLLICIQHSNS